MDPSMARSTKDLAFASMAVSPMLYNNRPVVVEQPNTPEYAIVTRTNSFGRYSDLTGKLVGDVAIACSVTLLAAPFLTVIDKALVQRSSGSQNSMITSAWESIRTMIRNPLGYCKSPAFLWMWGTYAATYTAANTLRTLTEYHFDHEHDNSSHRSMGSSSSSSAAATVLFVGTTFVNSTASLLKDRAYAQMFGNQTISSSSTTSRRVPRISYALWMARDFTVIGSSFLLPGTVAQVLQETGTITEPTRALQTAQFLTPVAAQFVAGPLHFVGYDCYNRNLNHYHHWMHRILDRTRYLSGALVEVITARILRIIPGYSIGGVLNTHLRNAYRDKWEKRDTHHNYKYHSSETPRTADQFLRPMPLLQSPKESSME